VLLPFHLVSLSLNISGLGDAHLDGSIGWEQLSETKGHHLAEHLMSGEAVPAFFHDKAKDMQNEIDTVKHRL